MLDIQVISDMLLSNSDTVNVLYMSYGWGEHGGKGSRQGI